MTLLTAPVAMISRRSGWSAKSSLNRCCNWAGKYAFRKRAATGLSTRVDLEHLRVGPVLHVSERDRQQRPGHARVPRSTGCQQLVARRDGVVDAVHHARRDQIVDQRHELLVARRRCAAPSRVEGARLVGVVREHELGDRFGHLARGARCAPSRPVSTPRFDSRSSRILMLTSWSDMSTPPELSTASVLMQAAASPSTRSAPSGCSPRLPPSATTRARSSGAVHAHAVVGAVADLGVGFGRRLHVGADAAVVEEIDLGGQDPADHFLAADRARRPSSSSAAPPGRAGSPWPSGRRRRRPR